MRDPAEKKQKSFSVAPSPFNPIKLELGIIIVLGILLVLVLNSITQNLTLQFAILFGAGAVGMVWIVWRTKSILRNQNPKHPTMGNDADR